jgi:uncharacterized protein (DUF58 family)
MLLDRKLVGLLRRMKVVPEKVRQRRSSGPGSHLSKGLGQSMDFSEYRPYQPGDDLRALDWKVYGRTDRLYTKLYVPEQEETVCFLLDTSYSMTAKWETMKTVVLGLANVVLGQGDRVAVLPLENPELEDQRGVSASRGRSSLAKVSRFLDTTRPAGLTPLADAFETAARKLSKRCHVMVLSDFLQPGAGLEGLAQLRYRRHRLSLIQLLAPQERDPRNTMSPGEWDLYDPEVEQETAAGVRLDIGNRSFGRYQDLLQQHNSSIQDFCRAAGAVFVSASTDLDALSFFSEDLRKAGLLA